MKIWRWHESGIEERSNPLACPAEKPIIIICGGGFNVDDPSQSLRENNVAVEAFFDFIVSYVKTDKATFKKLICGTLLGKQELNYFIVRKLLGLISGVPSHSTYPASIGHGYSDELEIFEISYTSTAQCFADTQKLYASTEYYSQDALSCAEFVFGACIAANSQNILALCAALQRITFFGISHGSNFLIELENALRVLLKNANFSAEDSASIMAQIVSIAISSIAPITQAKGARFTSIYFEGLNDKLAEWINPYKVVCPDDKLLEIQLLAHNRMLVLSHVVENARKWLEVIPEFDYFWIDNDKAGHYTPFYTLRCDPENIQPELVERALRNAVRRPQTPVNEMYQFFKDALPLNAALPKTNTSEWVDQVLQLARNS